TLTGNFSGYTVALSTATTNKLNLTETLNATPGTAYWKGTNSDGTWNTFSGGNANTTNWVDGPNGTATNQVPGSTTDVYETADTATNLTQTLGANFTIRSLTFTGTGTANTLGTTINAGNTLTINATAGAYTAGTGIVVQSGS